MGPLQPVVNHPPPGSRSPLNLVGDLAPKPEPLGPGQGLGIASNSLSPRLLFPKPLFWIAAPWRSCKPCSRAAPCSLYRWGCWPRSAITHGHSDPPHRPSNCTELGENPAPSCTNLGAFHWPGGSEGVCGEALTLARTSDKMFRNVFASLANPRPNGAFPDHILGHSLCLDALYRPLLREEVAGEVEEAGRNY